MSAGSCPDTPARRIVVHPDVIAVANKVIAAIEAVEKDIFESKPGYNLVGTLHIYIDDQPVASIEWFDDAWCLVQPETHYLGGES